MKILGRSSRNRKLFALLSRVLAIKEFYKAHSIGIVNATNAPTLYMKLEVEQTPKGEVEKNYLVCYPTWGKKKPPVRIE
jgi:hypothetical protein